MRLLVPTLFFLLIYAPMLAAEWDRPFIDERGSPTPRSVEDKDRSWKEGATSLPPWPNDGDLVEFSVDDPESRFRYYIDGKHSRQAPTERYAIPWSWSPGAVFATCPYEGLRCTPSGVFKLYAYGNNGRFEAIDSNWVSSRGGRRHDKIHRALHGHILCIPRGFEPRPKQDMIRAMRTGVPNRRTTGFLPD